MALYSDLREIKAILEIDPSNTVEDKKLHLYNEWAGNIIEEYVGRPVTYKSRTEYPKPSGTQELTLKARPVYTTPTIQVFVDESAYYGSVSGAFDSTTELTYGEDFALDIDQENGTSRSGILVRIDRLWPKPRRRQAGYLSPFVAEGFGTIKVVYTAGYTVDNLPAAFRTAANLLVARLRYLLPLGLILSSESYEERAIAIMGQEKGFLLQLVRPLLFTYRNWRW